MSPYINRKIFNFHRFLNTTQIPITSLSTISAFATKSSKIKRKRNQTFILINSKIYTSIFNNKIPSCQSIRKIQISISKKYKIFILISFFIIIIKFFNLYNSSSIINI